jgi:UDP-3-O-[3-hydroxymyristoyl] glucosamine N-acyltransferase
MSKRFTASDVAERVDGRIIGRHEIAVTGIAALDDAKSSDLSFLGNARYARQVKYSDAGIILVPEDFEGEPDDDCAFVTCSNPSDSFSEFVVEFAPAPYEFDRAVHPTAVVADSATLADSVHIGACAVVGNDAVIGEHTIVEAGSYIGHGVTIGGHCHLHPNTTVLHDCRLGNHIIIHSGTVIGGDGFGYISDETGHRKIPQLGIVQIDDDVEIGSNTSVDRARFGKTWIKAGVKIDSQVMIAHNVVVGEYSIIVAQAGIAGSTELGHGVIMAGQTGSVGHVHIGDGAVVMARAGVICDIEPGSKVMGFPARARSEALREAAASRRLPDLVHKVRELERRLKELEAGS